MATDSVLTCALIKAIPCAHNELCKYADLCGYHCQCYRGVMKFLQKPCLTELSHTYIMRERLHAQSAAGSTSVKVRVLVTV